MPSKRIRLVRLTSKTELVLFLISAELKSSKFFKVLAQAGLEDCYYQHDFCGAILSYCGFEECTDELGEFYFKLVDKYTSKVEPDRDSVMKYSMKFYMALMAERKRISR
ncbi:MAG TPA: hypothetical protein VGD65_20245 [Chryseosolibacter sp.]